MKRPMYHAFEINKANEELAADNLRLHERVAELEVALLAERERCAAVCDTKRAVFGAQSLIGDSYTRGLIDGIEGCANGIRATQPSVSPTQVSEAENIAGVIEIDPGHVYQLPSYDGGSPQPLTFMKREGEGYPFNVGHHPGTNSQSLFRAAIMRHQYLQSQEACDENPIIIRNLRNNIWHLEIRAAQRHGRQLPELPIDIENVPTCKGCGHIGCTGNHKAQPASQLSDDTVVSSCPHLHQDFPGTAVNRCSDCGTSLPESVESLPSEQAGEQGEDEVCKALAELREMFPRSGQIHVSHRQQWGDEPHNAWSTQVNALFTNGATLSEAMAQVRQWKADEVSKEEKNKV